MIYFLSKSACLFYDLHIVTTDFFYYDSITTHSGCKSLKMKKFSLKREKKKHKTYATQRAFLYTSWGKNCVNVRWLYLSISDQGATKTSIVI